MGTILIIAVVGTLNIACFFIGFKLGERVAKGEKAPTLNPIKAVKEHNAKKLVDKEAEREQERIKTIMENIDSYNGTPYGQKDV
jgi:hypothetical protein